ncbi:MAG: 4Fe-4S dicluster domain-containing protein [Proteobacteria bacterium]|nr:4Fe-4S dicluster domain-containing protein [Pseudomonadota bacterium]
MVEGRTQKPLIKETQCNKCQICGLLCPDLCITQDRATDRIVIDYDYCKGCRICAAVCPKEAITMVLEE